MFKKLLELLPQTPEQKTRGEALSKATVASIYFDNISKHVHPVDDTYPPEFRHELVNNLTVQWLTEHARDIFPTIDEIEIEKDWIINHPDHDTREKHSRFTMRQLQAWIDNQKHNLA